MAIALDTKLSQQVQKAAQEAGLAVVDGVANSGFNGLATEKYTLAMASAPEGHTTMLELTAGLDLANPAYGQTLHNFLLEAAKRLRNPPHVFQKSSETRRPIAPTTIKMTPIVFRLKPSVLTVTAYFRMAPTAIRKMLVPMPMTAPLVCEAVAAT